MKQQNETAVAKTAYGKTLENPIEYGFGWQDYSAFAELVSAGDTLSEDEQVKVRNQERKAAARQAALSKALDDAGIVKPTTENDPQLRLKKMFQLFVDNGMSQADAKVAASNALGYEWED